MTTVSMKLKHEREGTGALTTTSQGSRTVSSACRLAPWPPAPRGREPFRITPALRRRVCFSALPQRRASKDGNDPLLAFPHAPAPAHRSVTCHHSPPCCELPNTVNLDRVNPLLPLLGLADPAPSACLSHHRYSRAALPSLARSVATRRPSRSAVATSSVLLPWVNRTKGFRRG